MPAINGRQQNKANTCNEQRNTNTPAINGRQQNEQKENGLLGNGAMGYKNGTCRTNVMGQESRTCRTSGTCGTSVIGQWDAIK